MNLENDQQLENTRRKLALLDEQINIARTRAASPENNESVQGLVTMANQLREEIVRFQSMHQRRAS